MMKFPATAISLLLVLLSSFPCSCRSFSPLTLGPLRPHSVLTVMPSSRDAMNTMDDAGENGPVKGRWNDQLLKLSNTASVLCLLHCTILPILTVLLPLIGLVSSTGVHSTAWLHALGHPLTLYVVLPFGTVATLINYSAHKEKWITALGWLGLILIAAANSGGGCAHAHSHTTSIVSHSFPFMARMLHTVQHGIYHRLVNLTGCALLIGSNYFSYRRKKQQERSGACCGSADGKPIKSA